MADFAVPDVLAEIAKQAPAFGLDPKLAQSLVVAENTGSGNPAGRNSYSGNAVSPAGARGVMQVMPQTARGLQAAGLLPPTWTHNPDDLPSQVQAGLAALKDMSSRANNPSDLGELSAMYNGGVAAQRAYNSGNLSALPAETQDYLQKTRRASMALDGNNPSAFIAPAASTVPTGQNAGGSGSSSSSSRTTTRRNINDPEAQAQFLADISATAGPGGVIDQTQGVISQQQTQRDLLNPQLLDFIQQQGIAAGAEATTRATVDASNAATRAAILSKLNLDPTATSSEMLKAFNTVNATDDAIAPLRADINQRMSVGFFDNPVQWLVNQTRLPGMVAEHNGLVGDQQNAIDRYRALSSIAGTQQSLSAATDADALMRAGVASAQKAAADANVASTKAQLDATGGIVRDAMATAQLAGQRLQLEGNALALTRQTQTESSAESERQAASKEEQKAFDSVNAQIIAAGGQPLQSLTTFKALAPAERNALVRNASSGKFGKDLASSLAFVDGYGDTSKLASSGDAAAATWINGTVNAAAAKIKAANDKLAATGGKPIDTAKAMPEQIAQLQSEYQGQAASDMRTASPYNPLKLNYGQVARLPALANNPMAIWLNKYGPNGSEPMLATVDEQHVVDKFAQSVATGTMTAGDAAKAVSQFYTVAVPAQAIATKWQLFGIDKPTGTYQVKLPGIGRTPTSVDMGNLSQVENAITRQATRQLAATAAAQQTAFFDSAPQ